MGHLSFYAGGLSPFLHWTGMGKEKEDGKQLSGKEEEQTSLTYHFDRNAREVLDQEGWGTRGIRTS